MTVNPQVFKSGELIRRVRHDVKMRKNIFDNVTSGMMFHRTTGDVITNMFGAKLAC